MKSSNDNRGVSRRCCRWRGRGGRRRQLRPRRVRCPRLRLIRHRVTDSFRLRRLVRRGRDRAPGWTGVLDPWPEWRPLGDLPLPVRPRRVRVEPDLGDRSNVPHASQNLGAGGGHRGPQQNRGDSHRLGRTEQRPVQLCAALSGPGQDPGLGTCDELVGEVDQVERRRRPGVQLVLIHGRAVPTHHVRRAIGQPGGAGRPRRPAGRRGTCGPSPRRDSPGCRSCSPGRRCNAPRTAPR